MEKKNALGNKMNWYKIAQQQKILYIMRGLSGSGKSSLAQELGRDGIVLSTDDFFMAGGKYEYDPEGIGYAHDWNQDRALKAMQKGISPIVIDNTNVEAWEAKPYVYMAIQYGYKVEIREPNTPWKFNAEELAKRNTHGVPKDVIDKMITKWQPDITVGDILNAEKPKTAII